MSVTRRLISGSLASWIQVLVTLIVQIVLVPIFLIKWSPEHYGIWLAIQSFLGLIAMLDKGHQYFLYFEALKSHDQTNNKLGLYFGSSLRISLLSAGIQMAIVLILIFFNFTDSLFATTDKVSLGFRSDVNFSLIIQSFIWVFFGISSGILGRLLAVRGYYPRVAWWTVLGSLISSVSPAIAVYNGASFLEATYVLLGSSFIFNIPFHLDMLRIIRGEGISLNVFSSSLGFNNFFKSLAISGKDVLENFRQQGIRVVLSFMVGGTGLAVFSTIRTGANVLLQGLNTITNPMIPELMRFLREKDQSRTDVSFNMIWVILVIFMSPCIIFLQLIIEPIFETWTKGKIQFDPMLFLFFSFSILIYTLSQPAIALVTGNNLLKQQLQMSIISGIILIVLMFVLIPVFGLKGAGIAVIVAELISTLGYRRFAKIWMSENGLIWPTLNFRIASLSIWVSFIFGFIIVLWPIYKFIFAAIFFLIYLIISYKYWVSLPELARSRVEFFLFKVFRKHNS